MILLLLLLLLYSIGNLVSLREISFIDDSDGELHNKICTKLESLLLLQEEIKKQQILSSHPGYLYIN